MITVIDLKIGNIASVGNALKSLMVDYVISDKFEDISNADKLIFPGVGNFFEAAKRLKTSGIDKILRNKVLMGKTPILGICLGMQLLASYGEEGGGAEGLNLIQGKVAFHRASTFPLRLPHIGWNDVNGSDLKLFDSIKNGSCFYFVHSYEVLPLENVQIAYCNYGVDFAAAVQKDNIIGVQFHPEKSQEAGLKILKNFCEGNF